MGFIMDSTDLIMKAYEISKRDSSQTVEIYTAHDNSRYLYVENYAGKISLTNFQTDYDKPYKVFINSIAKFMVFGFSTKDNSIIFQNKTNVLYNNVDTSKSISELFGSIDEQIYINNTININIHEYFDILNTIYSVNKEFSLSLSIQELYIDNLDEFYHTSIISIYDILKGITQ